MSQKTGAVYEWELTELARTLFVSMASDYRLPTMVIRGTTGTVPGIMGVHGGFGHLPSHDADRAQAMAREALAHESFVLAEAWLRVRDARQAGE